MTSSKNHRRLPPWDLQYSNIDCSDWQFALTLQRKFNSHQPWTHLDYAFEPLLLPFPYACTYSEKIPCNIFGIFHFWKFFLVPLVLRDFSLLNLAKHWRDEILTSGECQSDSRQLSGHFHWRLNGFFFLWLSRAIISYNEKARLALDMSNSSLRCLMSQMTQISI